MIRQRKNKAYLQKSSFKLQNNLLVEGNLIKNIDPRQNSVFQVGIFNKFFKLSINKKNPITYASKTKISPLLNNNKSDLCIQGLNTTTKIQNKENQFVSQLQKSQSQSKMLLLQTTGNGMLPFKKFKRNEYSSKQKRPRTALSTCRSSIQRDGIQNSISRILQELNQNQFKKPQQKISTSQALVLYSKVVRNNENSTQQYFKRRIKSSSNQRYKSVSIMANKVNIGSKDSRNKKKPDFKEYLQKFKSVGNKSSVVNHQNKRKIDDFDIGGWDTQQGEFF